MAAPDKHLLCREVARILKPVDQERLSEQSPSILIPLLQAAADESREELQSLWGTLLANAMLDNGRRARRALVETLKLMEPRDAHVLGICNRLPFNELVTDAEMEALRARGAQQNYP
jgi:hypothetical protein